MGDGEVRATLDGSPILTRYPAYNSPFGDDPRRLVQSFLVTAGAASSLEERRILFLNGVLWLLGNECDNFLTEPYCTVIPPDHPDDPCAPFTLLARLGNNGRCQARGVTLTTTLPEGFDVVGIEIRSTPEGANSATSFRDGRQLIFAVGRVEHDTEIEIQVQVVPSARGSFRSQWTTRSLYRPVFECAVPFTSEGAGCAQPRLEVRLDAAGHPEFRVEAASGTFTLEVSEDLIRWTPRSNVGSGVWLAAPIPSQAPNEAPRHFFLRVVR